MDRVALLMVVPASLALPFWPVEGPLWPVEVPLLPVEAPVEAVAPPGAAGAAVAAAWAAAALDTARKRRRDHSLLNFIVLTFAV